MLQPICTIYKVTNIANGKIYVGQTWKTLHRRLRCHINDANAGVGHCTRLVRAILKYGAGAFVIEMLAEARTQIEADLLEDKHIVSLNTIRDGYNLRAGGAHGRLNEETRAKMSAAHNGKIISKETRAKIASTLTGRKNGPPSAETRAKISDAHRGQKHSAAVRAKMSTVHRGKLLSANHRARQTAGKRAMWLTMAPERRKARVAQLAAALQKRWNKPKEST